MSELQALLGGIPDVPPWLRAIGWASLCGTVLAAGAMAMLPAVRGWVPAKWRFMVWMVVLVRFLPLPWPESRWSVFGWMPTDAAGDQRAGVVTRAAAGSAADVAPSIQWMVPEEGSGRAASGEMPAEKVGYEPIRPAMGTALTGEASNKPAMATGDVALARAAPLSEKRPPQQAVAINWGAWLTGIYLVGGAAVLLRIGLSMAGLMRLVRRAEPVCDGAVLEAAARAKRVFGMRRELPVLAVEGGGIASPALVGLWRPRVLVPRGMMGALSAEEMRLVFLHECAHLRRRDVAWNYLMAAVTVVQWFNPVLWLILPRVRAERELAADEAVLAHTSDAAAYGHTLLKLAETSAGGRTVVPAVVGILENSKRDGKTLFSRRIHMIARFKSSPKWVGVVTATGLGVLVACSFTGPERTGRAEAVQDTPAARATGSSQPAAKVATNQAVAAKDTAQNKETPTDPLEIRVKELNCDQQGLGKVLDYLRDATGANLVVQWNAITSAGIDQSQPITVTLKDVPLRKVLRTVLDLATEQSGTLDFEYEDGVIMISTAADLKYGSGMKAKAGAQQSLRAAYQAAQGAADEGKKAAAEAQQWVENDPTLRNLQADLLKLEQEQAVLRSKGSAASNAMLKETDARIQAIRAQIEKLHDELNAKAQAMAAKSAASPPNKTVRIYDVREIVGIPANAETLTADQRAGVDELVKTLSKLLDPADAVSGFNGMVIVNAPEEGQSKAQGILDDLRQLQKQRQQDATKPGAAGGAGGAMDPKAPEGLDPEAIAKTDERITWRLPLKNISAARLTNDLAPLLSADAVVEVDEPKNTLIVTDTSAKISRVAQIISKLDRQPRPDQDLSGRSFTSEEARRINELFWEGGVKLLKGNETQPPVK